MPDSGQFTVSMQQFIDKTSKDLDRFVVEFPQDLKEEIVEATPVKTGNLRRGWYDVWNGSIYSLINGVSYGPFVEFGTSRMAPRAFVRRTLARADLIAQKTLERIRGSS